MQGLAGHEGHPMCIWEAHHQVREPGKKAAENVQSREVSDGTLSADFVPYLELSYHGKRRLLTFFATDAP